MANISMGREMTKLIKVSVQDKQGSLLAGNGSGISLVFLVCFVHAKNINCKIWRFGQ
jgi:hypothetical protein